MKNKKIFSPSKFDMSEKQTTKKGEKKENLFFLSLENIKFLQFFKQRETDKFPLITSILV